MQITKIYGPPGTGKTTKLLEIYKDEIRNGTDPKRIAFISHTKVAINEGKTRIMTDLFNEGFQFSTDDFYYWRTMHSMAYLSLSKKVKIEPFSRNLTEEQHRLIGLKVSNLERYKKILENPFTETTLPQMNIIYKRYIEELKAKNSLDFAGILVNALMQGNAFEDLDVVLIDEAQDFSSIQFALVEKLFQKCDRIYYAGDDDQAIYAGLGADEEAFVHLKADNEICLDKSYRLPESVHDIALSIINNINNRAIKTFTHNGTKGRVAKFTSLTDIDSLHSILLKFCLRDKSVLILALSKYELHKIIKPLLKLGLHINFKNNPYAFWTKKQFAWAKRFNFESKLDNTFSIESWNNKYPEFSINDINNNRKVINWIEFCAQNNKNDYLSKIEASTVHGAKGKEADIVIFYEALPRAFGDNRHEYNDDLYKLLYVAVTRAKEELYFLPNFFDFSKTLNIKDVINRGKGRANVG